MQEFSVHEIVGALQRVFGTVAERAAHDSGFVQRKSKLTGEIFVQALTFGWLRNPEATLEELAQSAASLGVTITPQGVEQRFGPRAAECVRQVLEEAVTCLFSANPAAIEILQRFPGGVCLLDTTTVTLPDALVELWPGCGGTKPTDGQAGLKLFARFNLLNGALQGPFLHPSRVADQTCDAALKPLAAGTLRLADLGFFNLDTFKQLDRQGVYWLTRLQPGTTIEAKGQAGSLADLLRGQTTDRMDVPIKLGARHHLSARLLALRVSPHVAAKRQERLRKRQRQQRGKYRRADAWVLTEWTVYVTNVPPEMLSLSEALVLGRCRWQVELLWKLWKSEGHIDTSRSEKPWRILCEVYAKLLGMVVQHWLLLVSCWKHADRSLVKASRTVRAHALELAVVLSHGHLVRRTLLVLQRRLSTGCRIGKRRAHPPNHQLLLTLAKAG